MNFSTPIDLLISLIVLIALAVVAAVALYALYGFATALFSLRDKALRHRVLGH